MAAPNRLAIVERVHREHPHLLRVNSKASCTEFVQRVLAAMPAEEQFGHLSKQDGEGGHTLPNGVRVSYDVICHRPTGRQIDIISAGAGGELSPPVRGGTVWQEIDPAVYRPHNVWTPQQPLFNSGAPGGGEPASVAELGIGWFCLLRAFQDWPDEILPNASFIRSRLKPKVWRTFLDVEGESHRRGNDPDVWRDAGIDGRAANWDDLFKQALDFAGNANEQLWCCVYGGRNHFHAADSRRRFHDRIVNAAAGRWSAIYGFEPMNEYRVNRWDEAEVRDAGRDLRSKVPAGTRLALSSPRYAHGYVNDEYEATNEDMADCIHDLYGGDTGATVMTVHKMRDPGSKWADAFAYNPFMPSVPKIDNEPFGDGASAGGDSSDPMAIAQDYQRTCEAGWSLRIEHPASWCIWQGRVPPVYGLRQYRNIWDVPHIEETFRLLRTIRDGGTVSTEPTHPIEPGGDDVQPYPSEQPGQFWAQYEADVKALVERAHAEGKRPTPDLILEDHRAFSRMGHSSAHETDLERAKQKHLGEVAAWLGVSR